MLVQNSGGGGGGGRGDLPSQPKKFSNAPCHNKFMRCCHRI